jgi:hypothetical protein
MTDDRRYTKHQMKIIKRYYDTAGERAVANLQDIATELYLATSDKKRKQLWDRAQKALEDLGVKPKLVEHIISTRKPEILAQHVKDLF